MTGLVPEQHTSASAIDSMHFKLTAYCRVHPIDVTAVLGSIDVLMVETKKI